MSIQVHKRENAYMWISAIILAVIVFIKTAEKTPHFNAGDESGY